MEDTDLILIHSNKLNYTEQNGHKATLASSTGGKVPSIKETWLKAETQYLVVQLNGNLIKGQKYKLNTKFTGELADDLGGFYRSEYMEGNTKK